ncbi:unnamed protein product [Camellia sinensis]
MVCESQASNGNVPENNFKNYGDGGNAIVDEFMNYREKLNVGDDSFQSYSKNSNSGTLKFKSYGQSFNECTDKFNGYGKDGSGRVGKLGSKPTVSTIRFADYDKKKGVLFARYLNESFAGSSMADNAKFANRWVELGNFFRCVEKEIKKEIKMGEVVMQVMTTGTTLVEEQLATMARAIEKLTKTIEKKGLQIASLMNKLEAQNVGKTSQDNSHPPGFTS